MSNRTATIGGILSMVVVFLVITVAAGLGSVYGRQADRVARAEQLAPKHDGKHLIVSTSMHVTARTTPNGFGVAVIHGCPAEDSCRPLYNADGTWSIRVWNKQH